MDGGFQTGGGDWMFCLPVGEGGKVGLTSFYFNVSGKGGGCFEKLPSWVRGE